MIISPLFCLIGLPYQFVFGTWGWPVPSRLRFPSGSMPSLPGLLCLTKLPPKWLSWPMFQKGKCLSSRSPSPAFSPPYFPWSRNLYHLCACCAQDGLHPSDHQVTHCSFSVYKQQVQRDTFLSQLPHHLCPEVISHTLGTTRNCFLSAMLFFQQTSGKLEEGLANMRLLPHLWNISSASSSQLSVLLAQFLQDIFHVFLIPDFYQ